MKMVEYVFWIGLFLIFYTYLGYGMILFLMVKIKELFSPQKEKELVNEVLPEVTLLIAAYNEEDVVVEKMENTLALDYPSDKLHVVWITDGSNDNTNNLLNKYPSVTVLFQSQRQGKTAALNRAIPFIQTPLVIFTDANTMINKKAVSEIVNKFRDVQVGCVAGEKRIEAKEKDKAVGGGEGLYWKYESTLKALDSRLYSAVGAAGELFAIRTHLFQKMQSDTLLDDFILSMRIAQQGYKIAYCSTAYAIETSSASMKEEEKRKIRISAGGLQSIWRLRSLLNIFRYGMLSFQYISHRVLRWSITPIILFLLFPINILLLWSEKSFLYGLFCFLQVLFYTLGLYGYYLSSKQIRNKFLFVPYYFLFMNINVIKGFVYLRNKRGSGIWEKAKRA